MLFGEEGWHIQADTTTYFYNRNIGPTKRIITVVMNSDGDERVNSSIYLNNWSCLTVYM